MCVGLHGNGIRAQKRKTHVNYVMATFASLCCTSRELRNLSANHKTHGSHVKIVARARIWYNLMSILNMALLSRMLTVAHVLGGSG